MSGRRRAASSTECDRLADLSMLAAFHWVHRCQAAAVDTSSGSGLTWRSPAGAQPPTACSHAIITNMTAGGHGAAAEQALALGVLVAGQMVARRVALAAGLRRRPAQRAPGGQRRISRRPGAILE